MSNLIKCFFVLLLFGSYHDAASQVINAGVGGNNTDNLLARLEKDVLSKKPDLVILMVGTNDLLNSKKMISYQRYQQNLKQLVKAITENGSEMVLMSSPPVDSTYLFERHDRKLFDAAPNVKMDSARNIVAQIANEHNLKFIDLYQVFSDMDLPKHNEDLFFRNQKNVGVHDGVHPTTLGYHFIGETVFYFLKEHKLLKPNQKLMCFGDSITRGGGTTYPQILESKIKMY